MRKVVYLLLLVAAMPAAASEWVSEVELGAVFTSGNTEQETVKFRADATRDGELFVNRIHVESLSAARDGVESAEKYSGFYRLGRKLDRGRSLFGRAAYEQDRFSGFKRQMDVTVGYGQRFLETETMSFDADFGVGQKRSRLDTGVTETDEIVSLAAQYVWHIGDNAIFKQFLSTEIGSELTTSRSESSLESAISGNLAMKLAIKFKHSSDAPVGKQKTDSESTVTLVYKF
ncbi:MAG: DUF481 domain-containing protein [Proteobacteria bacterium]|jgi:putative salt-induced outer membrane protein|nr:DUF481 domain-containing protein [Pseudomonadota bacterium]MDA1299603.1 DUF481 domain-containing protein [Pseudomonadota bacterium]